MAGYVSSLDIESIRTILTSALGSSLHSVVSRLRGDPAAYPHMEIAYSSSDPFSYTIIVKMEANGLDLYFDGSEQTLRLISINCSPSIQRRPQISYKGIELNHYESLNFKSVYNKIFGPTYPGSVNTEQHQYVLSYPGLSFSFDLPTELSSKQSEVPITDETALKLMNGKDSPICSAMAIHRGTSWSEVQFSLFGTSLNDSYSRLYAKICADNGTVDLTLQNGSTVHCKLHSSTMQDVFMELGPPDERVFKRDSRLSIHNPNSEDDDTDLFFNYFGLGVDFDFDTSQPGSPIKKVILHGNVPDTSNFQKYNRCRWRLVDGENQTLADSESKFGDCASICARASKPMVLNRLSIDSPSSSVELLGEVPDNTENESLDWGVTELYGVPHCIFEVIKNGVIASLVIY